ncbi:MAG: GAF domain-containing protein [Chloroflexi bacterium]|nr:GAF domain-containing protein [Chloroflexota bacterium]
MRLLSDMKLQHRIILSVVLGLSVVMLIFGYASLWALNQSTEAAFRARLGLARTIASYLDGMIEHSMDVLGKTAELPALKALDSNPASVRQVVQDTQARLGTFAVVTLLDSSGKLLMSAPQLPNEIGSDMLYHPGARNVVQMGQAVAAELPPPSDSQTPLACLAVPIWRESGDLAGVLMAELDPGAPGFHLTQSARSGNAARVELLNRSRTVVDSVRANGAPPMDNHFPLLVKLITERRVGVTVHVIGGGASHVVAYAPLSNLPDWGVAVEQPEYAVLALPRNLQTQMVIFGSIALLAAVLVAWMDVRRVVKPLRALTATAARIGAGDLASPVPMQRGDEVGTLAYTLEAMRQGLCDLIEKRKQHEAELEKCVEQRTEEVTALLATSEAFAATLDLSALLEMILAESRHVCPGADAGMVATLDKHSGSLAPVASFGCHLEPLRQVRLRPGEGVVGKVFESGKPSFFTNDELEREDGDVSQQNIGHFQAACLHFGRARSALCVPLVAKQNTVGVLILYDFHGPLTLSEHELKVLQAIASQAAVAVENAQLYEEVQQKEALRGQLLAKVITAQEEERHRIARELHDESAQALTALMMALDAVEKGMTEVPHEQSEKLHHARRLTERALGDVRRVIWDLRPIVLDDLGLGSAVRWYAQQRLEAEDIRVQVSTAGLRDRLPARLETELYRILQEAITNIAKHAHARNASIQLRRADGRLSASVEDDGRGFQLDEVGPVGQGGSGLGLLGMRERVELLGGTFTVHSSPGSGTRLTIEVPLERNGG